MKEWGRVFKDVPDVITQHASFLFYRYIEKGVREHLRKARCETTVGWEGENNITHSMKVAEIARTSG